MTFITILAWAFIIMTILSFVFSIGCAVKEHKATTPYDKLEKNRDGFAWLTVAWVCLYISNKLYEIVSGAM